MQLHPFKYTIRYSNRKTLAICIAADGQVTVRVPERISEKAIHSFLTQKESWVLKHLQPTSGIPAPALSEKERRQYMEKALAVFSGRIAYYASLMGVTYGRVTIREQKTRWGSCSAQGNLNFNWRLIFAPLEVLDYVVVHELAHRKEMNHSRDFYALISSILPDYIKPKKWLHDHGQNLWQKP